MNLAVLCGIAVTTAVLTGALLVGDSVQGSLRALALDRLGRIDHALVTDHFVRQDLAAATNSAPAILLNGTASANKKRASGVNISAVKTSFLDLFSANALEASLSKQGLFLPVIINQALADEMETTVGDELLLSFSRPSEIERETILGNRDTSEVVQRSRFSISAIIPNEGMGLFTLNANQHLPFNAFVPLERFQRLLGQPQKINAMLQSGKTQPDLKNHLRLEDLGLKLVDTVSGFALESDDVVLKPSIVNLSKETAQSLQLKAFPVLTYLANEITHGNQSLPYSTVTAVTPPQPFVTVDGRSISTIGDNEILLNEWAAADLNVLPGETVALRYFVLAPDNRLKTNQTSFQVEAVIRQVGLAADPDLTPQYPGIQNAQHISDWSPPFPVDLRRIRPKDEEYWNLHRATPKAFISENAGKKIWSSRFGTATSIRFAGNAKNAFAQELLKQAKPEEWNLQFRPVKEEGLRAANGATDFAGLFIGFSLFLIISSVLLVSLLFRLGVEQRQKEIGVLLACGYGTRQIQSRFLGEAIVLTGVGVGAGLLLAKMYASWIISALQSRWIEAIGSSFLSFYSRPASLFTGFLIAFVVCLLVILYSVRALSRRAVVDLLKGATSVLKPKHSRWNRLVFAGALIAAIGFTAGAFFIESPALFFAAGASFLLAALTLFSIWLRSPKPFLHPGAGWIATWQMSARNAIRNPGRSLLSVCLVASACFVIVAVGANRRKSHENPLDKQSGTGGFNLVASTDVPVYEEFNFNNAPGKAEIFGFRLLPGDDASCLNLYQPQKPRILGVPDRFIRRGGFIFQQSIRKTQNPWSLLKESTSENVISAIGDYNSVRWILHKNLGEEIPLMDESGRDIRLQFVALLEGSLLQSEVLISEDNFLKHFPSHGGRSYFLIQTNPDNRDALSDFLESELSSYGFDAMHAEEKLASYHAVENTYLSTFQTLGALGLLLGTLGLGIVLVRNVLERRSEMATLRAFGFQRKTLGWLVLTESAFLLAVGISSGGISAGVAVLPHLLSQSPDVPIFSLSITLLLVFCVGMLASTMAVFAVLRIPLLPALKESS